LYFFGLAALRFTFRCGAGFLVGAALCFFSLAALRFLFRCEASFLVSAASCFFSVASLRFTFRCGAGFLVGAALCFFSFAALRFTFRFGAGSRSREASRLFALKLSLPLCIGARLIFQSPTQICQISGFFLGPSASPLRVSHRSASCFVRFAPLTRHNRCHRCCEHEADSCDDDKHLRHLGTSSPARACMGNPIPAPTGSCSDWRREPYRYTPAAAGRQTNPWASGAERTFFAAGAARQTCTLPMNDQVYV
jgi:hypothetical protein